MEWGRAPLRGAAGARNEAAGSFAPADLAARSLAALRAARPSPSWIALFFPRSAAGSGPSASLRFAGLAPSVREVRVVAGRLARLASGPLAAAPLRWRGAHRRKKQRSSGDVGAPERCAEAPNHSAPIPERRARATSDVLLAMRSASAAPTGGRSGIAELSAFKKSEVATTTSRVSRASKPRRAQGSRRAWSAAGRWCALRCDEGGACGRGAAPLGGPAPHSGAP